MRRALCRAWWALAIVYGVTLVWPASAQTNPYATADPTPARPGDRDNGSSPAGAVAGQRSLEIRIALAWLADPLTFPNHLAARQSAVNVEVRGYVPNAPVRDRALSIARAQTALPVVDHLKIHPNLAEVAVHCPTEPLQLAVNQQLQLACPAQARNVQAVCNERGDVLLAGPVASVEDALVIAEQLRRVPGCSCVISMLRVGTAQPESTFTTSSTSLPTYPLDAQTANSPTEPMTIAPKNLAAAKLVDVNGVADTKPAPISPQPAPVSPQPANVPAAPPTPPPAGQSWTAVKSPPLANNLGAPQATPAQTVAAAPVAPPVPATTVAVALPPRPDALKSPSVPAGATTPPAPSADAPLGSPYVTTGVVTYSEPAPLAPPASPPVAVAPPPKPIAVPAPAVAVAPPPPPPDSLKAPIVQASAKTPAPSADAPAGMSCVATGVVAKRPTPAGAVPLPAAKAAIEKVCGPRIHNVRVEAQSGKSVLIHYTAANGPEAAQFWDKIKTLPELLPYEVQVEVDLQH